MSEWWEREYEALKANADQLQADLDRAVEALRESRATMQEALEQAQTEDWWSRIEIRMEAAVKQADAALPDPEREPGHHERYFAGMTPPPDSLPDPERER